MKLYFHSPCLDGIASAVVACRFLERNWSRSDLMPVGYEVKRSWAELPSGDFAVVDFLFHPRARLWADHHRTTFVSRAYENAYRQGAPSGRRWAYDPAAPACAVLLERRLFGGRLAGDDGLLVQAALKTDSARYDSPEEAVLGDGPALRLNRALADDSSAEFSQSLVLLLLDRPVHAVALSEGVRVRSQRDLARTHRGIDAFRANYWRAGPNDALVRFDVRVGGDVGFNRYTPYLFASEALYSIGVVRSNSGAKVTAMRNPWIEFPSVAIGDICRRFGGGGHERVGSILVPRGEDASRIAGGVAKEIAQSIAVEG